MCLISNNYYVINLNFQKLKLMLLKKDDMSINSLLSHLRKINSHLEKKNTRFLTGDTMCCFDCELMPRLQHIRVAGELYNGCPPYRVYKILLYWVTTYLGCPVHRTSAKFSSGL